MCLFLNVLGSQDFTMFVANVRPGLHIAYSPDSRFFCTCTVPSIHPFTKADTHLPSYSYFSTALLKHFSIPVHKPNCQLSLNLFGIAEILKERDKDFKINVDRWIWDFAFRSLSWAPWQIHKPCRCSAKCLEHFGAVNTMSRSSRVSDSKPEIHLETSWNLEICDVLTGWTQNLFDLLELQTLASRPAFPPCWKCRLARLTWWWFPWH